MKALNCKPIIIFLALIISGSCLYAKEVKKSLQKEFSTNSSSVLSFDIKFSELHVESWDNNQVSFEVQISAEHDDESKAKKMLDMIDIVMEKEGNVISFVTVMDKKFSKTDWGKSKRFKIKIDAKVPVGIKLDIENRFGTVNIGELNGNVSIESAFGSVIVDRLTGKDVYVEISNGDFIAQELSDASIEINYGSISIQRALKLDIEINTGSCKIGTADILDIETNIGDVQITKLAPSFKSVDIENNTGSVIVGIDKNAGFHLEASISIGSLSFPKLEKLVKKGRNMNQTVTGTYGDGNSKISISGNVGSIDIILK